MNRKRLIIAWCCHSTKILLSLHIFALWREGLKKGREEGREKGLKEGLEEGKHLGLLKAARTLIEKGKTIKEVSELLELPLTVREKLEKELDKYL